MDKSLNTTVLSKYQNKQMKNAKKICWWNVEISSSDLLRNYVTLHWVHNREKDCGDYKKLTEEVILIPRSALLCH